MQGPIDCKNCGAKMAPQADGRVYVCPFCQTKVQVGIAAEQIAAGFDVDFQNIDAFLARLANALHQGFREHSRIEANGSYVMALEVNLEPEVFLARREGAGLVAQHKRVVRGIALKTATLPIDRWYEMLTEALARHANQNARAAWVLAQIGGRR
jgi:uncharacterized Zn finger protein (UPF0148 family)